MLNIPSEIKANLAVMIFSRISAKQRWVTVKLIIIHKYQDFFQVFALQVVQRL